MSSIAVYPGTFDPITFGHIDMIQRSLRLFDKVIVAVAQDTMKETLFSLTERVNLAKTALSNTAGVEVQGFRGLLVEWMHVHNWNMIVRGVRWADDMHDEWKIAMINKNLASDIETVWLTALPKYGHISASIVRHIAQLQGDVTPMVPACVVEVLRGKY